MDFANRGVTFILKAEIDPAARKTLDDFGGRITAVQAAIDQVASSAAQKTSTVVQSAAKVAADAIQGVQQVSAQAAAVVAQNAVAANAKATAAMTANTVQGMENINSAVAAAMAKRQALIDAANAKELAKERALYAAREEAVRNMQAVMEDLANMQTHGIETDAQFDEDFQELAEQALEAGRAYDKYQDDKTKKAEQEAAKREKAELAAVEREIKTLERKAEKEVELERKTAMEAPAKYDSLMEKSSNAARRIVMESTEMTESIMRFARGLAHAGLVGEKDMQKVMDTLLRMQSIMDVFSGGVRALIKMDEMYRALRTSITAAAAAQEILNASQARGAIVGNVATRSAAGGVVGGVIGQTFGQQIATQGVAGAVAGRVSGMAVGALSGIGGAATSGLGVLGGAGVGVAGGGVAAVGASILAAGASIAFALTSAGLTIREAAKNGFGQGATKGSFVESVGTSGWNPFAAMLYSTDKNRNSSLAGGTLGMFNPIGLGVASAKTRQDEKDAEAHQQKVIALIAQKNALQERAANLQREYMQLAKEEAAIAESRRFAAVELLKPEEKRQEILAQISDLQSVIDQAKKADPEDTEASASLVAARESIIRWQERRLANEKEISQVRRDAAREDLAISKQALEDVERRIEAEKRRAMSAAERFGLMSEEDRGDVLSIKKRLDAGDKTLTGEELSKVRGFSAITDDKVSQFAQDVAAKSGFGKAFGGENAAEMQNLQSLEKKLQLEVKQKTDVIVRIDEDIDLLAKKISEQIDEVNAERQDQLAVKVAELQKQYQQIKDGLKNRVGG